MSRFAGMFAAAIVVVAGSGSASAQNKIVEGPEVKWKLAAWGKKVWMKHGALQYFECAGDDLVVPPDCGKDFKTLLSLKPTETVFFSFIVYKNKAQRNAVNKRVMAEMTKESKPKVMPFERSGAKTARR